jgi:hypothetical protein
LLDIAGFIAEKNALNPGEFLLLLEIEYADGEFLRWFRSPRADEVIAFDGHDWSAYGFSFPTTSGNSRGEIPTFTISISNAEGTGEALLDQYTVEGRQGRLIIVNRNKLADATAQHSEYFTIAYGDSDESSTTLTCSSVRFNPLRRQVPARLVTRSRYPGVAGTRSRYF